MKNLKKLLVLSASLFMLVGCGETTPTEPTTKTEVPTEPTKQVEAKEIDISFTKEMKSEFEVDSHLYGMFFEDFRNGIYDGVYAEEITDRKFYYPVDQYSSQWKITKGEVGSETGDPFQGTLSVILNEGSEIRTKSDFDFGGKKYTLKNKMGLLKMKYNGYFYARGTGNIVFHLYVEDGNDFHVSIPVDSLNYKKYSFDIDSLSDHVFADAAIECVTGKITIDSVSLMRSDNYKGLRKDVLDGMKEVAPTYLRFPGGNFVSNYDWREGIGDKDLRNCIRDAVWNKSENDFASIDELIKYDLQSASSIFAGNDGVMFRNFDSLYDPNDMGISDFLNLCEYIGAEPNLIVNSGTGTAEMARQEVEYVNGSKTSEWGKKRPADHAEPYNVRVWGVGNEMQGDWQFGHVNISEYAERHNQFAREMRSVDPSIKLIACSENNSGWGQSMVDRCGRENIDFLSEHFYSDVDEFNKNNLRNYIINLSYDKAKLRADAYNDMTNLNGITMACDEFAYNSGGLNLPIGRMRDAYAVASTLNTFEEYGYAYSMATYSFFYNYGMCSLLSDQFSTYLEPVGLLYKIRSRTGLNHYIPLTYKGGKSVKGYYEISATVNEECTEMSICVINTTDGYLKLKGNQFNEFKSNNYLAANTNDYMAYNVVGSDASVTTFEEKLSGNTCLIHPNSISMIRVSI